MKDYILVITREIEKTPEEIEQEVKGRPYNERQFQSEDQYRYTMSTKKIDRTLSVTITEEQFEAIRKAVLEKF